VLFPEHNGASLLALADIAAKFHRLPEGQPEWGFVAHRMEQEDIDSAIGFLADKVSRQTRLRLPRLPPGDSSLFQQGNDAFGDLFINAAAFVRADMIGMAHESWTIFVIVFWVCIHGVFFTVRADRFDLSSFTKKARASGRPAEVAFRRNRARPPDEKAGW